MKFKYSLFSKYKLELYGLMIIWIVLYHGYDVGAVARPKFMPLLNKIIFKGNCGVEFFLLLSGIFAYYSYNKYNDIFAYYSKRIIRIFIPLILIDYPYWIYKCLFQEKSIYNFLSELTFWSFFSGRSAQVWYIVLILILYLCVPYLFKLLTGEKNKVIIKIMILIFIIYLLCYILKFRCGIQIQNWFQKTEVAWTRIPIFIIGMYIGKLSYKEKEIGTNIKILSILLTLYGISQFCYNLFPVGKYFRIPYLVIGFGGSIFWVILFEVIDIKNVVILDKVLTYLGSISLEIYLSHIVLRRIWLATSLYSKTNKNMNLIMYLLIVFLGSVLISKVVFKIENKIYNKLRGEKI